MAPGCALDFETMEQLRVDAISVVEGIEVVPVQQPGTTEQLSGKGNAAELAEELRPLSAIAVSRDRQV